jgi:mannose-1-phosphate guanylyltransferase/phosphomannomutase
VDVETVRSAGFKLVLDYAFGTSSFVMPNVLAKLGADVLAVNPYASTAGAVAFDRWRHSEKVAELMLAAGAHVGAVIDPDGEHITLIDDSGHVLTDNEALYVILSLVIGTTEKPRVAVPVAVSRAVEELCERTGAEIAWAKLSTPHLMELAAGGDVAFAGSQEGGYIFPAFLPAYDATATLVHVLAMLGETGLRLSKLTSEAPRTHIAHDTVVTPWDQKGAVMRTLVEQIKDRELVLVDGVKILYDDGWALVLPDPEEPISHVWAEGPTDTDARTRAQEHARIIRQLLR